MHHRTFIKKLVGFLTLSCFCSAYAQQVGRIDWQDPSYFTDRDRKEILTLAKRMGIENPTKVYQGQYIPIGCPYVRIESVASETVSPNT